jgi:hypothetical protein
MSPTSIAAPSDAKSRRHFLALLGAGGAGAVAALVTAGNSAYAHGTTEASSATSDPAIHGDNTVGGPGVVGTSDSGDGVSGSSTTGHGVSGFSSRDSGVFGRSETLNGVHGESPTGVGVAGDGSPTGIGVLGGSESGNGVHGNSGSGVGVFGHSQSGVGIAGGSETGFGVQGFSPGSIGVHGVTETNDGVMGLCTGDGSTGNSIGVHGFSANVGVSGESTGGVGVSGLSQTGGGVVGDSRGGGIGGRFQSQDGMGVQGLSPGDTPAVQAWSANLSSLISDGGLALDVIGKARFSTAGAGAVPRGANSVFVANAAVTGDSHITVTLTGDPGARQVRWIGRTPGSGLTVNLSPAPPSGRPQTPFTYLVVEPST